MTQQSEHNVKKTRDGTKIGAVIILIISAVVFIPFGASDIFQSLFGKNKAPVFGSFDGKDIVYEQGSTFANAVSNIADGYKSMGQEINTYSVFAYAFETTVQNMAYMDAVKKTNYQVPESAINRNLLNYYLDAEGKYSPKLYNQTAKSTREMLRKNVKASLAFDRYEDDLFGSRSTGLYGLKSSTKEVTFLNEMGKDLHSFNYVTFNTSDFPKEEAVKWAKSNSNLFTKYDLSIITVDDEASAKSLLKQLNANEITFEDAVSEKSQKYYSESDGKLTRAYDYQFAALIANEDSIATVKNLAKGSTSDVIQTVQGYSIFRCDDTAKQADFTNEDIQNVVLSYIKGNERGYIEEYFTNIAKNFVTQATATSFEEACKTFNVENNATLSFPVNYGNSSMYEPVPTDSGAFNSLATNAEALKTIFSLKQNEMSSPIVLGSYVTVIKCTGIASDTSDFDADLFASKITTASRTCAAQTLLTSSKVENNVWATYFSSFANFD